MGLHELTHVKPLHVAAFLDVLLQELSHHDLHLRAGQLCAANECRRFFMQARRGWARLHEKGGKEHEVPCHHKLEIYLDEYIAAPGIADDDAGALFRTTGRSTGTPQRMEQPDACRMIQRQAKPAGITAYLKGTGTLEHARALSRATSQRGGGSLNRAVLQARATTVPKR